MAVQSFVKGDDLKKLIDDKLINAQSVKYVLRQKGILPVCTNSEALSDLIHHHFFWLCNYDSDARSYEF